jgi:hypothetical protein
MLGTALAHQFMLVAGVAALTLLTLLVSWRELLQRRAWPFLGAIVAAGTFWVAFGLLTDDWHGGRSLHTAATVRELLKALLAYPTVLSNIVAPWMRVQPVLTVVLAALAGIAAVRCIVAGRASHAPERVLLTAIVFLGLAAGALDHQYHETRYTFFLYPAVLAVAAVTVARIVAMLPGLRSAVPLWSASLVIGGFIAMEDASFRHLVNVDSREVNFRIGMTPAQRTHFYPRVDARAAADWLRGKVSTDSGDIVVNGSPAVNYYYDQFQYYLIPPRNIGRIFDWSCGGGGTARERWGNHPLLYSHAQIERQLSSGNRVYIVINSERTEALLEDLARWRPRVEWTSFDGGIQILAFHPA